MSLFRFQGRFKNRVDLYRLLHENGLRGEVAEIGVWLGDFSERFLHQHKSRRMHLVDPWAKLDDYDDIRNEDFDPQDYARVRERFEPYGDTVQFHRMTSMQAAKVVPDGLDMVYIDANHAYEHVLQDLRTWWKKVRRGGILAGHDLFSLDHLGVTNAVVQFAQENQLTVECIVGDYNENKRLVNDHSYYFEKP